MRRLQVVRQRAGRFDPSQARRRRAGARGGPPATLAPIHLGGREETRNHVHPPAPRVTDTRRPKTEPSFPGSRRTRSRGKEETITPTLPDGCIGPIGRQRVSGGQRRPGDRRRPRRVDPVALHGRSATGLGASGFMMRLDRPARGPARCCDSSRHRPRSRCPMTGPGLLARTDVGFRSLNRTHRGASAGGAPRAAALGTDRAATLQRRPLMDAARAPRVRGQERSPRC